MKRLFLILLLMSLTATSQNYIDLFKIGYSKNFSNEFEGTNSTTDINSLDIDLTVPFKINEKNAIITGVLYSQNNLSIAPGFQGDEEPFYGLLSEKTTFYSTTLKVGWVKTFTKKWTGTFVVLPKLSSDYQDLSGDDFYVGGIGLLKFQKNEHLRYKLGLYASDHAFGLFAFPILGLYYLSPNEKLEMDITMPIAANIDYKVGANTSVGFNYLAISRSFDIHKEDSAPVYLDYLALEFTGYLEYGFMDNSILVRAKGGYSTNSTAIYDVNDKVDLRVSAINIGDDRVQLNPDLSGSLFAKLEAVYRFDFSEKE